MFLLCLPLFVPPQSRTTSSCIACNYLCHLRSMTRIPYKHLYLYLTYTVRLCLSCTTPFGKDWSVQPLSTELYQPNPLYLGLTADVATPQLRVCCTALKLLNYIHAVSVAIYQSISHFISLP
jgi:hypothetical protein